MRITMSKFILDKNIIVKNPMQYVKTALSIYSNLEYISRVNNKTLPESIKGEQYLTKREREFLYFWIMYGFKKSTKEMIVSDLNITASSMCNTVRALKEKGCVAEKVNLSGGNDKNKTNLKLNKELNIIRNTYLKLEEALKNEDDMEVGFNTTFFPTIEEKQTDKK